MNRLNLAVLCGVLVMASAAADAQQVRVRGDITAFDGNVLSVRTREGRDVRIELAKDAAVAYPRALNFADIKPGTPLATTAVKGADGKLVAREVRAFPVERGVTNEGHRPIDTEPNATMTNAMVSALAQAGSGRELVLTYKGGSQTVVVPETTPVVLMVQGDRSLLVPGAYIVIASARMDNDGKLSAGNVYVSKDGVRPPN